MDRTVTLYHGTDEASADALLAGGWAPNSRPMGGQCGNPRLLYLTTDPENALWYANEKGSEAVLAVVVPVSCLVVDPEDGTKDTVEEELAPNSHGLPGNVAARLPVPASAFGRHLPSPAPGT